MTRTWKHKVRGSTYAERGRGALQSAKPIGEGTQLVGYQDAVSGTWYFRPEDEFIDGRFEEINAGILPDDFKVNDTMVYVYEVPAKLADGYCFQEDGQVWFLNLDWFNGFDGMTADHLRHYIQGKRYARKGRKLLVLSPTNGIALIIDCV